LKFDDFLKRFIKNIEEKPMDMSIIRNDFTQRKKVGENLTIIKYLSCVTRWEYLGTMSQKQ